MLLVSGDVFLQGNYMQNRTGSGKDDLTSLANTCLEFTSQFLEKYRYRVAGTPECRSAAHEIANHFREVCDDVKEEPFTLHPKALWFVGKAIALAYLISAAFLALGGFFLYLGAFLCLTGLGYALVQYVFYGEFFDRFFKSAEGCNMVGTLEPEGVARQQVILCSHHDSPFLFSFLERFQSFAFIRFLLGMLAYAWLCTYSFAASIHQLLTGDPYGLTGIPLWITIIGLPFAFQLFFMMSKDPSPGAGDNLNSTSMLACIAQYFRSEQENESPLRNTRLVFLSTDGEEIGQRGAIQYVKSHYSQLHEIPSFVFNVDSVFRLQNLKILTRDRNFTCKLSDEMAADICKVAGNLGLVLKKGPIPFGGGGTDAGAFAVANIKAISIIGMPTGFISKDHLYHTSKDLVENIELGAVRAILNIATGYIKFIDHPS
jgi:aminopeptidase YwaD